MENEKVQKYKFEEKYKGRRNLSVIDIEPVDSSAQDKMEADLNYYENVLKEYEKDIEFVKTLSKSIEKDVIDESFAE